MTRRPGGRFEGRIGIVTGAASGLGRATALALAAEGARLLLADRDMGGLKETAAACPSAITLKVDVTRAKDQKAMAACAEALGPVSLLATAAGTLGDASPWESMAEGAFDALFAVNVKGTWLTLQAVLPLMRAAGGGAAVTFASTAGLGASPALPAYSASKGAVVMMTRSLAPALAPQGIRINCVCPGSIETPMLAATFRAAGDEAAQASRRAAFLARHPIGRFGQAEEVAESVLFLLSDAAAFTTGVALPVDGGRLA